MSIFKELDILFGNSR